MTTVTADSTRLRLDFPGWESLMVRRDRLEIPLDALRDVRVEPGWTSETLGIRSGLVVSGRRKLGIFRHPSGLRRLVSMRRGMPLLRVGVDRAATGFDELLLSAPDAARLAATLTSAVRS